MIDRLTFDRIQARIHRLDATPVAREVDRIEFCFRGFLRCECGRNSDEPRHVTGSHSRGQKGQRYAYYHCLSCGNRQRADRLEAEFSTLLAGCTLTAAELALFDAVVREGLGEESREARRQVAAARRRREGIEASRKKLVQAMLADKVDKEIYRQTDEELKIQWSVAKVEESECVIADDDLEATLAFASAILRTPVNFWNMSGLPMRKALQWLFFPEGLILLHRTHNNTKGGKDLEVPAAPDLRLASLCFNISSIKQFSSYLEYIRQLIA